MADDHHLRYKRVGSVQLWQGWTIDRRSGGAAGVLQISPINRSYWWKTATRGLDFKFHFTCSTSEKQGVVGMGSVSILGLSGDTIRSLVSYATPDENLKKRTFITVYAGYGDEATEDNALTERNAGLFTLAYTGADMTMPPNMWLNFYGRESSYAVLNNRVVSGSVWADGDEGMTVKEACKSIAESMNLRFRWGVSPRVEEMLPKLNGLDYSAGCAADVVKLINEWDVVQASVALEIAGPDKGFYSLVIRDKVGPLQAMEQRINEIETSKIKVISADNGMIGLPQYTPQSETSGGGEVTVKTLLRKDIQINDLIQIKSQYMPQLFPWYRVNKISYDGHFRGQEWYSTFTALYNPPSKEAIEKAKREADRERARKMAQEVTSL